MAVPLKSRSARKKKRLSLESHRILGCFGLCHRMIESLRHFDKIVFSECKDAYIANFLFGQNRDLLRSQSPVVDTKIVHFAIQKWVVGELRAANEVAG